MRGRLDWVSCGRCAKTPAAAHEGLATALIRLSRVTRSAGMASGRLDVSVAVLALALPFALPVLLVAWMHPAVVANPGSAAVASVAPHERPTAKPTATQPGGVSPTRAPDTSPATVPATDSPATDVPATDAPASSLSPTLGPTLTQPPTATIAGPTDVAADPCVLTGFLLLGGLGIVFAAMPRRHTRGRARNTG